VVSVGAGCCVLSFFFLSGPGFRVFVFNGIVTHDCVMARDCKSRKKELGVDGDVLLLTLKFPL
jgi:hypothetical protein